MRPKAIALSAKLATTFALALLATACSPKSSNSSVQIAFPNWQDLQAKSYARQSQNSTPVASGITVAQPSTVSINTSLNGGPTRVAWSWSKDDGTPLPPEIALSEAVDNGTLVQVLVIFDDQAAQAFYYGDAPVSQNGYLDITLTDVAATQALIQGNVIGRYLTAPNKGPTGVFQYRFSPVGKPSMVVTTGEVFSGWMNTFALNSRLINYTWPDGTPAFDVSAQDASVAASAYPKRAARIYIPAGYENDSHDSGQYQMNARPVKIVTAGFFGPYADQEAANQIANALELSLCYTNPSVDSQGTAVDNLYRSLASSSSLPTDAPNATDQMMFIGSNTPDSDYSREIRIQQLTNGYGGDSTAPCPSTGSAYQNYLVLDPTKLKDNDSILPFKGPFAETSGHAIGAVYDTTNHLINVTFRLLPGVEADSAFDGVSIFYRELPSGFSGGDDSIRSNDGYKCNAFAAGLNVDGNGVFTEIPLGKISGNALSTFATTIPAVPTQSDANRYQIVACPRAGAHVYYRSGASWQQNGGSGGGGTATQLAITGLDLSTGATSVQTGVCAPYIVRATDSSGNLANPASQPIAAVKSDDLSNDAFYTDPSCSSGAGNPMSISNMWNQQIVYFKTTRVMGTVTLQAFDSASSPLTTGTYIAPLVAATAAVNLATYVPATFRSYQCQPVTFELQSATGSAAQLSSGTASWSLPSTTGLSFYADGLCTQPASGSINFYYGSPQTTAQFWAIFNSPATTVTMSPTGSSNGVSTIFTQPTVTAPTAATNLSLLLNNTVTSQTCAPVQVVLQDASFHPAPAPTPVPVTLTAPSGGFFSSKTACDSSASDTIGASNATTISTGTAYQEVWYRNDGSPQTLTLTASSTSYPSGTGNQQITLTAPVANRFVMVFPGQQLNSTTWTTFGTPQPFLVGLPNLISIYAISEVNKAINNFSWSWGSINLLTQPPGLTEGTFYVNAAPDHSVLQLMGANEMPLQTMQLGGGTTGVNVSTSAPYIVGTPQLAVATISTTSTHNGVCIPMLVSTTASMFSGASLSTAATLNGVMSVPLVTNSASMNYYSTADCATNNVITSVNVPANAGATLVYYQTTVGAPTSGSFSNWASAAPPFAQSAAASGTYTSSQTAGSAYAAAVIGATTFSSNNCQAFAAVLVDANGNPTVAIGPQNVSLFGGPHAAFYSDSSCTNPAPSATVMSGQSSSVFYMQSSQPESAVLSGSFNGQTYGQISYTAQ